MSCVPLLLLSGVAAAGEQRATPFDWSGLYLGGHVGYSRGNDDATYFIPGAQPANHNFGTIIGGAHAGYNVVLPSRILIGIEADATFPNFLETDDILVRRPTPQGIVEEKFGFVSTVRGRVGLVRNDWLLYATAGYAWSQARFIETPGVIKDEDKALRLRSGFAAGGGVERALTPEWSARAEYLYTSFAKAGADLPSGTRIESTTDLHQLRVGLTYHFGHSASGTPLHTSMASPLGYDQWNVHGQMTHSLCERSAVMMSGTAAMVQKAEKVKCAAANRLASLSPSRPPITVPPMPDTSRRMPKKTLARSMGMCRSWVRKVGTQSCMPLKVKVKIVWAAVLKR